MLLTEEDARKKLCHRTLNPITDSLTSYTQTQCCFASDCMAWRWGRDIGSWAEGFADALKDGRKIDAIRHCRLGTGWSLVLAKEFTERVMEGTEPMPKPQKNIGYCGLAGEATR